jgi:hypothetical protein
MSNNLINQYQTVIKVIGDRLWLKNGCFANDDDDDDGNNDDDVSIQKFC